MSLKYAGAQITAPEERRSAASPSIAAPSQLMTASFPRKLMRTTAEVEFREQREFGDGRKRPRVSGGGAAGQQQQQGPRRRPDPLSARRRRCYRRGWGGWWKGEVRSSLLAKVSASIAVASRVPSSTVMEGGGQSGNEDGGNNEGGIR